jgi:hypothetical protein
MPYGEMTVSRGSLTADAQVHSQISACEIWGGNSGIGAGFSPKFSVFPCQYHSIKRLRWSRGSVLAFGIQVRRFAPGRSCRIFRAKKIFSTLTFGGEVNPLVPCRSFTSCKRFLNVRWRSAFRQNYRTFLAHSCTFRRRVFSRGDTRGRRLVAKVGTSNPDRTISLKGCSA